jgi:hypothetical protein
MFSFGEEIREDTWLPNDTIILHVLRKNEERNETTARRRQQRPIHRLFDSTQFFHLPTKLVTASSPYIYVGDSISKLQIQVAT